MQPFFHPGDERKDVQFQPLASNVMKCVACDAIRKFQEVSKDHKQREHALKSCDQCINQRMLARTANKKLHQGSLFTCDVCRYATTQKGDLRRHISNKHVNLYCIECGLVASNPSSLIKHMNDHKETKHHCKLCDFTATKLLGLVVHNSLKHNII